MKKLIIGLALIASFALPASAAADYVDAFGNHYTDAQVTQFCHALRPGSASYLRYDCGTR